MSGGTTRTTQKLFSPIIHTVLSGVLAMPDMERLSKHVSPRFAHATVWIVEAFKLERLDKGPREALGELFLAFKAGTGQRVVFFCDVPLINMLVQRLALAADLSMPPVRTREEYQAEIMKAPEKPLPKS